MNQDVADLIDTVATVLKVSPEVIKGRRRDSHVALARMFVYHLGVYKLQYNYLALAKQLSRNHATIIHGCRTLSNRMSTEPKLREKYRILGALVDPSGTQVFDEAPVSRWMGVSNARPGQDGEYLAYIKLTSGNRHKKAVLLYTRKSGSALAPYSGICNPLVARHVAERPNNPMKNPKYHYQLLLRLLERGVELGETDSGAWIQLPLPEALLLLEEDFPLGKLYSHFQGAKVQDREFRIATHNRIGVSAGFGGRVFSTARESLEHLVGKARPEKLGIQFCANKAHYGAAKRVLDGRGFEIPEGDFTHLLYAVYHKTISVCVDGEFRKSLDRWSDQDMDLLERYYAVCDCIEKIDLTGAPQH